MIKKKFVIFKIIVIFIKEKKNSIRYDLKN